MINAATREEVAMRRQAAFAFCRIKKLPQGVRAKYLRRFDLYQGTRREPRLDL
jgi:hypothetical protein